MEIRVKPVATVKNSRKTPSDDFWGEIISEVELCDHIPDEAFEGISAFSHLEIIYFLILFSQEGRVEILVIR
jgi:tRNA (Thr-GGU) A37 N-methylase